MHHVFGGEGCVPLVQGVCHWFGGVPRGGGALVEGRVPLDVCLWSGGGTPPTHHIHPIHHTNNTHTL